MDPTLSPELHPAFTLVFLGGGLLLLAFEIWGVSRTAKGDTITEHWRWAHAWLNARFPWFGWMFRVWTGGILVWALLHFLAGAD